MTQFSVPFELMRRQVRRTIFYSLIIIFLLLTVMLGLFALGYSIDWGTREFTKTGGIFVKANVSAFSLYVNGVLLRETNFLTKGALADGLLPGTYEIHVEKKGYTPWQKAIEAKSEVIQEFRNILLVPDPLPTRLIFATSTAFSGVPKEIIPDPTGNYVALVSETPSGIFLAVVNLTNGTLARPVISLSKTMRYIHAEWDQAGTQLLLETSQGETSSWDIIPAESAVAETVVLRGNITAAFNPRGGALLHAPIREVNWSHLSGRSLYILSGNNLYLWDVNQNQITKIISDVVAFGQAGNQIVFAGTSGFLGQANLDGSGITAIDRPGFYEKGNPPVFLSDNRGLFAFIDGAGGLFLDDPNANKFLTIAGVNEAHFAPHANVLGMAKSGHLDVILTQDEDQQPFSLKFTERTIVEDTTPIRQFIWYGPDSTHLIFVADEGVFLTEADSRFGANTTRLFKGAYRISEIPTDPTDFYVFDGTALRRISLQ